MTLTTPEDTIEDTILPLAPELMPQPNALGVRGTPRQRGMPRAPSHVLAQTLTVSVVVPTCNRPGLLDRCLAALLTQTLAPEHYEIVIVDDAGSPATRAQVARWCVLARALERSLRYVAPTRGHGPAAARNAGWRAARGEVIAFTDDDCVPAPGWLCAGLAALAANAEIAGISGKLIVPIEGVPTDYERDASRLATAEFVTANCFYRREALERIGGFDERFPLAWREDSDLHFRLLAAGARLVRAHDAVVVHPVRPARWGVSIGQQRKSMYNALLYKRHPRLYRERIQARPPLRYYAIVGALFAAAFGVARGRRRVAASAGLIWLALTGDFCACRLRDTARAPRHIAEMAVTSAVIPPLSVYWRLRGALKYRVWFL